MPDIAIGPVGLTDMRMQKIIPSYLVVLDDKANKHFVATKFDDTHTQYAKLTGFYVAGSTVDDIVVASEELIKTTDTANFVEILVPWAKISVMRSLVYKHRAKQ